MRLQPGLYEQIVSRKLGEAIQSGEDENALHATTEGIDKEEASRILSAYIAQVARRSLDAAGNVAYQVELANKLIGTMSDSLGADDLDLASEISDDRVQTPARELMSVVPTRNTVIGISRSAEEGLPRPSTSVAQTSLFTGARHEPQLYTELKKELASADEMLMLVSFIKWSGFRLIRDDLEAFCERGGKLYAILTSYMGATDPAAVQAMAELPGAQVRVSYDTKRTRLHAKAYVFVRNTGFTTAYVGSSNLSNVAITSGLEWNVKMSRADQPDMLDKIEGTFETYWNSDEFEPYDSANRHDLEKLEAAIEQERHPSSGEAEQGYYFDISPYPFQQRILEKLMAEREVGGHWRNLVVAATGTGKTVIAAFDYREFCQRYNDGRKARLLFVAHREEILKQALSCFRGVLHDANFGELYVGHHTPHDIDHLFCSIQTLNSRRLVDHLDSDYYDYIVIDEVHHAPAASYQEMLEHFTPRVLLGLTATPERMDGKSLLSAFDGRIAAEIRLPEAIDRNLLCPFSYFGVSDEVDLSSLRWQAGGYVDKDLENLYVFDAEVAKRRAAAIAEAVRRYTSDPRRVRGLGFCVSKAHAEFMAREFSQFGIPSAVLTSDSNDETRANVQERLRRREINFIFVVDLYNEGVDIPEVDTVLFLRPTKSLTVFLQQLGRGLRLSPGKDCLTVLDFIGQANRHFDFTSRLSAMLEDSSSSVLQQIQKGFTNMPKGCYIQLERVAREHVLSNISDAINSRSGLAARIVSTADSLGHTPTLAEFLDASGVDPRRMYERASYARLCVDAGVREGFSEEGEQSLTKALRRLASVDSRRWIRFLLRVLDGPASFDIASLTAGELRMYRMFQVTVWPSSSDEDYDDPRGLLRRLAGLPVFIQEARELLAWELDQIDFVDEPVDMGFDCPLDLHCRYSRDQILLAMDVRSTSSARQGVLYVSDKKVDLLMSTLNKSEKEYSATTMYKDYSISPLLFHWQSQNKTSDTSQTGQRYIHHAEMGSRIALFVRESKKDQGGTAPYMFLGLADYVSHTGSRPMDVIWRLRRPIPAKLVSVSSQLAS